MNSLLYWHWLALGAGLLVLEMLAPGAIFMWFGAGAILVGALLFLFPAMSWELQVLIFALASIAALFLWKKLRKNIPQENTQTGSLNRRAAALIGRQVALLEAIKNGVGKVQIDDTFWRVQGEDMPAKTTVRVISAEGSTLKVEKVV